MLLSLQQYSLLQIKAKIHTASKINDFDAYVLLDRYPFTQWVTACEISRIPGLVLVCPVKSLDWFRDCLRLWGWITVWKEPYPVALIPR